ncbi:MAG: DcaP family trimeric outer membrane transporter [Bacteroidales bacterium]|jgi:hypothetical protein
MKKNASYTLMLVCLLFISQITFAQTKQEQKSDKSPFLFEKGNTSIKFGGFIRAVTFADFGGSVPNYDFISSTQSAPNVWDNESRLSFDASATRLNLKVIQKVDKLGDIEFFVETDFRGASDVLRLRQAYVSFAGFTFGQTWSFMSDLPANAPTIDIQGVNSRTFFRTPLIGYRHSFDNGLSLGIALEFPKVKMGTLSGIKAINQNYPDVPIYVQYKNKNGHIKLAGVVRNLEYGNVAGEKIKSEVGLGVQLSGMHKFGKSFSIYSQIIYGKGIARYINDLAALNLDLVADNVNGGVQAIPMYGASLGIKADLSKSLYFTSNYSVSGISVKDNYYSAKDYFRGSYYSASLFWGVVKNLTIAGEYIHGYRQNMDLSLGNANRAQLMVMYSF